MSNPVEIIIIEDDLSLQALYRTIAEDVGITYHIMGTVAEVTEWLTTAPQSPKMAVLDHCLPDGDGMAIAQALQQHFPSPYGPIIVLVSGLTHAKTTQTGMINHVLVKPFSVKAMTALFQQCVAQPRAESTEKLSETVRNAFIADLRAIADDLINESCDDYDHTQRRLHSLIGVAGMLGETALSYRARQTYDMPTILSPFERKLTLFRIATRAQILANTLNDAQDNADHLQRHIA